MSIPSTRDQRRQLARDNAKLTEDFVEVPREAWPAHLQDPDRVAVWRSKSFLVQVYKGEGPVLVRLSINRTQLLGERWIGHMGWDELQRIKDDMGYLDRDAVEVYPKLIDVVNVANMRHLWVMREPLSFAWRFRANHAG